MIAFEPEMTYWARAGESIEPTHGSPHGAIQYLHLADASLRGKRINAKLISSGNDWMQIGADGYWRPDVRAQFRTDDGAVLLMHYTGLIEYNQALLTAASGDQLTECGSQYMRMVVTFITGAEQYRWLNSNLFVAAGRRVGAGQVEYDVYRVT